MGKTVGESDSPYMEKRPEVLLEAYKNAYPYLRVAKGSGVPEKRLDALEEKLDSREDIITQLLENGKYTGFNETLAETLTCPSFISAVCKIKCNRLDR